MNEDEIARVEKLQARINSALTERPEDLSGSRYSDYLPDHTPEIVERLMRAALPGNLTGVEAAMNEFNHLAMNEDRLRMQRALMLFMTHHPAIAELGLQIPSLEERGAWKTLPRQRNS